MPSKPSGRLEAGRHFGPAPSYLHMHANRLLRSAHGAQELVLYDFLCRLYESRAARARERTFGVLGSSPS